MRPRIGTAVVTGRSMLPTLREGDRLLLRYGRAPRTGDLVLVRLPASDAGPRPVSVKRVTMRVPEGWWVERDNPAEGADSWLVGAVAEQDVVAVVIGRWWPRPRTRRGFRTPPRSDTP